MDPIIGGALIGGGASLLGGILGTSGQSAANRSNERIARENRAFQERMSSTAYQRAAKDLDAAGLNRILALGSPASSPGGSTAVMQNAKAPLAQGISSAVSAALQAQGQMLTNNNVEENTAKQRDERAGIRATEAKTLAEVEKVKAETLNELKRGLNLDTENRQREFELEIRQLEKVGIQSESDFWKALQNADLDGLIKIMPVAGPIIIPLIRAALMGLAK